MGSRRDLQLYKAARDGDHESALDALASGANVRYRDVWDNMTPLLIAAYRGHAKCVVLLLGKGASPMTRTRDGSTPLHFAAGFGHMEVCKVLCGCAITHATNHRNETPIDWALGNGRTHVAELLSQTHKSAFKGKVLHAKLFIALKQHIRILRARVQAAKEARESEGIEAAAPAPPQAKKNALHAVRLAAARASSLGKASRRLEQASGQT